MTKLRHILMLAALTGFTWFCSAGFALGQGVISLNDLSAFKNPGKSWQIAQDVSANLNKPNTFNITKGTGVLVNVSNNKHRGTDLFSNLEHGDATLELDFMLSSESNSGIYFQGRYELQLIDSWTARTMTPGSNGGIYQRWDDSKPNGQKGFEGNAPRQNASKAPGLWQHLRAYFKAPQFDASGKKTANAKFLKVELNGVTIHENIELSGPTRGSISADEKPLGPIRIQGDHGTVAFKNINISPLPNPKTAAASKAPVDPILVEARVNTILRSFVDIDTFRVVHAVSVGSSDNIHYTYDLDRGAIVQVWRGDFLDATPMWHNRGNGTSKPAGAVQLFGKPTLTINKLSTPQATWTTDTTGTRFKIQGYETDIQDRPTFIYSTYGASVKDATVGIDNGKGFTRTITLNNAPDDLYVRLAEASSIDEVNGYYLIDDKAYYLRIDDASGEKPFIRNLNGRKELIIPVRSKLSYSILF